MNARSRLNLFMLVIPLAVTSFAFGQTREEKVRADRKKVVADGFWMYNDIPGAFEKARDTGKPILVVLRCIPCEECVKLDDDLVDKDPVIRPLLEKFVCVRQVSTNGLDLNLFQYDTDQSFAVFMLNAEGTIYGRFGTRSHRTEWLQDVSLPGLAKALQGALDLHADFPSNKAALAGKRGAPLEFASPEKYPALKDKFTDQLNYEGEVAKSCIHCHQIGEARRDYYWSTGKPVPEKLFYPYPHPKTIGLIMDPEEMATIKDVVPGSAAANAGLRPGDRIRSLNDQVLLSIADIQWVLDQVDPAGATVGAEVTRGQTTIQVGISLADHWRAAGDLSWRTSTWAYRRVVSGGMVLEAMSKEERDQRRLPAAGMALRVKYVGQYGPHGAAKRAGVAKDDIVVAYDGQEDFATEAALIQYAMEKFRPGKQVEVTLLRGGQRKTVKVPIQR